MRFAFWGQEGIWWSLGDAGNPIDRCYNMTSRICVNRRIKWAISARANENGERRTYVLADDSTTGVDEAEKRNSLVDDDKKQDQRNSVIRTKSIDRRSDKIK